MWAAYGDDGVSEDWTVDGEVMASVRKPPVSQIKDYPWFASIAYEGRHAVAGYFPNSKAAKAAAVAILSEFSTDAA